MQKRCFSRQSANNAKVIESKRTVGGRETFRATERLLLTNEHWKVEQGLIEDNRYKRGLVEEKNNTIARILRRFSLPTIA